MVTELPFKGVFGRLEAINKYGYPVSIVGEVIALDDEFGLLTFKTSEGQKLNFLLSDVKSFEKIEIKV